MRTDENGEVLTTDGGHYIIDLHLEVIEQPESLATYLDELVGVVEHGLFLNMVSKVVVGSEKALRFLTQSVVNKEKLLDHPIKRQRKICEKLSFDVLYATFLLLYPVRKSLLERNHHENYWLCTHNHK